jgi:hypothetical protein
MPTLVYRYGIAAPHDGADVVLEQMRLAHEYRCTLVRIERGRRAAVRVAQMESSAELRAAVAAVESADAEYQRLKTAILADRKASRKRTETATMRADLAEARERLKGIRRTLYEVRSRYAPQCAECRSAKSEEFPCAHAAPEAVALRAGLDTINGRSGELHRSARHHSGLAWGSYLVVERAMQASKKTPLYEKDGVTAHDPPFPPMDAPRAVAVQIQSTRPLSAERAFAGKDSRLQLAAPPWPEAWLASHRPESVPCRPQGAPFDPQDPLPQPSARLPVGRRPDGSVASPTRSDGSPARWVRDRAVRGGEVRMNVGRGGEWASWRLDYHRALPPNASITWAIVKRHRRGPHSEWSLHLTIDTDTAVASVALPHTQVAIDVGWRQMDGELRVAACTDGTELRLSAVDVRALRQVDQIRSERDVAFDMCKLRLRTWIAGQPGLPDWMNEAARAMTNWRRQGRMVALLERWTRERPERSADEEVVHAAVSAWALADSHRWAEQEARRAWGLRRRRDKYRVWAAQIAKTYGTVVIEKFDLREMAERAPVGEDETENETARSNRQLAAVSELRGCLINAVRQRGGLLVTVSAVDSTRTCPGCGVVDHDDERDAAASVTLVFRSCGHQWDQDMGAATVLLGRYRESPGDAKILAGARGVDTIAKPEKKKGDQWGRARRMAASKSARMKTARK